MPLGLKRLQATGHSHFITFTCYRRLRHLTSPVVCTNFVRALEHARKRRGTLAQALKSLKIGSSHRIRSLRSREHGTSPLWQKRYYDRYMRDDREFSQTLRYIHRNPVKRGLCVTPLDWPWSSFRHYATGVDVGVEVESEWIVRARL